MPGPTSGARRLAARGINRLLAPLHERRHRRTAPFNLDREALSRIKDSWWGGDSRWYPAGTPPRRHNRATPLIDGAAYFEALHAALHEAREYVYVIGWCITPHIPLRREDSAALLDSRLQAVLVDVARRLKVRVLLWSGAPFLFEPNVAATEAACRALESDPEADLQCRLDRSARFSHCHHQKAIVIDGQVAFVGGMDLTTFQGDRWDTPCHPLRAGPNWHDVQIRIEGEAVADVEHNFRQRWQAVTGDTALPHRDPHVDPKWATPMQILRTIPRGDYDFARGGEFGIHHAYIRAIRRAERLIYLENQYLWSPEIMAALIAAMRRPHQGSFRVVIVLPARAYDGKWDNDRHVEQLRSEDRGRGIVSVYCPYASGPNSGLHPFAYRPIYVHAKVAVIDDEWLMIGSANLNSRGLITDSEIVAAVSDPDLARNLRVDLWSEHLGLPRDQVAAADPIELVDRQWTGRAEQNAAIIKQADRPLICAIHRYEPGRMAGTWFLEEAEAVTVEH